MDTAGVFTMTLSHTDYLVVRRLAEIGVIPRKQLAVLRQPDDRYIVRLRVASIEQLVGWMSIAQQVSWVHGGTINDIIDLVNNTDF